MPLDTVPEQQKTPKRMGVLRGSIHTHTSGIGYGAWRDGPPSERFPTWRSESDKIEPDFGHSTTWQHKNPERRCNEANRLLVSGEIGNWLRPDFVEPNRERYKFLDRTWHLPETGRGARSRQRSQANTPKKPAFTSEILSSRINTPVSDLKRSRSTCLSLESGRLDPTFARSCKRDLSLQQKPDLFASTLPFQQTNARAAFAQNELSSSLTRHWTHALRGQRY
jgi:hypothetical protein